MPKKRQISNTHEVRKQQSHQQLTVSGCSQRMLNTCLFCVVAPLSSSPERDHIGFSDEAIGNAKRRSTAYSSLQASTDI